MIAVACTKTINLSLLFLFVFLLCQSAVAAENDWERISGPVQSVFVGNYPVQDSVRILATKPPSGDLYEFQLDSQKWTQIGGPGKMYTVDSTGRIFGLSTDGASVHWYQGQPMRWKKIGGAAASIQGVKNGVVATNPETGDVYHYDISQSHWIQIGGPNQMLAADGKGTLYALSPENTPADKKGVYRYSGSPMKWEKIGGPSERIFTGYDSLYATSPGTGDLYEYNSAANSWSRAGGPGKIFAAGNGTLFGLAPDGSMVVRRVGSQWQRVGGPAHSIYAAGSELLAIAPDTRELFRYTGQTTVAAADFLLIAPNDSIATAAQEFVAWKKSIGHAIEVVTLNTIESQNAGRDTAERLRNFLIDRKGKGLHYVLLLGDIDQIPTRILYAGNATSLQHRAYAADFYYANLHTLNWDPDGDQMWGEFEDDQFDRMAKHDVVVSRIPFNDASRIQHALDNAIEFEKDQGSWKRRALLACAFSDPQTDGAWLGERIDKDILMPSGWTARKLYYRKENTVSSFLGQPNTILLERSNLVQEIGPKRQGLITLSGHGNPTALASYYTTKSGADNTELFHGTSDISSDFCSAIVFVSGCSTGPPVGGNGPHPGVPIMKSLWTAAAADTRAEHFGKNYLAGGAVAVLTASAGGDYGQGWKDPQDGMCQSLTYYFTENLVSKKQTAGDAFFNAMDKYVDKHGLRAAYESSTWLAIRQWQSNKRKASCENWKIQTGSQSSVWRQLVARPFPVATRSRMRTSHDRAGWTSCDCRSW